MSAATKRTDRTDLTGVSSRHASLTGSRTHDVCLVFAGKDASRALGQSSLKPEECRPDWSDLSDEHKKVLSDWFTFFSKRYNIKGKVEGATNF